MSVSHSQKPREMFRWAFQEQLRTRIQGEIEVGSLKPKIEAAAVDAFDYVWKRYGLETLDIRPGRP